jgi:hypothetical protein
MRRFLHGVQVRTYQTEYTVVQGLFHHPLVMLPGVGRDADQGRRRRPQRAGLYQPSSVDQILQRVLQTSEVAPSVLHLQDTEVKSGITGGTGVFHRTGGDKRPEHLFLLRSPCLYLEVRQHVFAEELDGMQGTLMGESWPVYAEAHLLEG